jgi:hypothetical protein
VHEVVVDLEALTAFFPRIPSRAVECDLDVVVDLDAITRGPQRQPFGGGAAVVWHGLASGTLRRRFGRHGVPVRGSTS